MHSSHCEQSRRGCESKHSEKFSNEWLFSVFQEQVFYWAAFLVFQQQVFNREKETHDNADNAAGDDDDDDDGDDYDLMEKSGKLNFQRPLLCFTPLLSTQN